MYIFTVFISPRALVSLLAVGNTRKLDDLVGNFVFCCWKGVSRVRFDYLWISYHHPSADSVCLYVVEYACSSLSAVYCGVVIKNAKT
jgi:hypothetical protein